MFLDCILIFESRYTDQTVWDRMARKKWKVDGIMAFFILSPIPWH